MKVLNGSLNLSASDVSSAFSCQHRTALDLAVARKERTAPTYFDPMTAALQQRGLEHEQRYVEGLRARGLDVVELAAFGGAQAVEATLAAMKQGVDAIVQASLQRGPWNGRADVLLRVEQPSALGAWSYEPVDAKLARETRAASILQLALYAELARDHLGALPERFCIVSPGEEASSYREQWERVADFHAYFRFVRDALAAATTQPTATLLAQSYPEPVEHCDVCRWWESCDQQRRADDHLSLVAGITRLQRRELTERGVCTLAQLAEAPVPAKLKRGSPESFARVRKQARMQFLARVQREPVFELLPIDPAQGLCSLPLPSAGDVFLDIEGNPFAEGGGREYLFGLVYLLADERPAYRGFWAGNVREERAAFESLMDLLRAPARPLSSSPARFRGRPGAARGRPAGRDRAQPRTTRALATRTHA